MSTTATLSARFRISIPKAIRVAQGWRPGEELAFIPKRNGVLVMPVPSLDELHGLARGADPEGYRERSDRT